jgi:hypothetical protein
MRMVERLKTIVEKEILSSKEEPKTAAEAMARRTSTPGGAPPPAKPPVAKPPGPTPPKE